MHDTANLVQAGNSLTSIFIEWAQTQLWRSGFASEIQLETISRHQWQRWYFWLIQWATWTSFMSLNNVTYNNLFIIISMILADHVFFLSQVFKEVQKQKAELRKKKSFSHTGWPVKDNSCSTPIILLVLKHVSAL